MRLHADLRFLPALAGAVAHFSERAGLDAAAQAGLGAAAEEAFRGIGALLPDQDALFGIMVADFPDRVEITFEHEGRPWDLAGKKRFTQADRSQQETRGGFSRLVLIKFARASA
jgi:hypothetical protein